MRILNGFALALAAAFGTVASATTLSVRDRAAIEALEQRVVPLPGPRVPGDGPAPLARRMAERNVPAVSVAYIEDGRVKWTRAYGEAVAGSGRAATPDTLFQAASMSKAVAAAGALRLVDRGRLSLDEDVNRRLRGWRVPDAPEASAERVTLRRLFSHTAGLSVAGYPGYATGASVPGIADSLAGRPTANTAAVRAFAVPGAQLAYSGGGYSVAQLLIAEQAGGDFARAMRDAVLRPARMTRSTFDQRLPANAAHGHNSEGVPVPGGANTYPELAAAGLWTTPADYGRFLIALQESWAGRRGTLLTWQSARAMMAPVSAHYGLGVMIGNSDGRTIVTHGGSNEGFQCRFVAFLDGAREGLVIMTNGDNGGALAAAIQRTVADAYGWGNTSLPPVPRAPNE